MIPGRFGAAGHPVGCPGCGTTMRRLTLGRKPHGAVEIDLCPACRGLWFDAYESLQLTPDASLAVLREGAAPGSAMPRPPQQRPVCPRCADRLAETRDLQRSTRFCYWRCVRGHGRFTPFLQFMREKDFLRPLDPAEIERLRKLLGTVRCSGCGAPVDLGKTPGCGYCGAPLEALDAAAVRKALHGLEPAVQRSPPPRDEATIDAWLASQRTRREPAASAAVAVDLVVGGLQALLATFD